MAQRPSGPDKYLTLEEVAEAIGVTEGVVRRLIKAKKFPPGAHVAPRKVVWMEMDVIAYVYLASRITGAITGAEDPPPDPDD